MTDDRTRDPLAPPGSAASTPRAPRVVEDVTAPVAAPARLKPFAELSGFSTSTPAAPAGTAVTRAPTASPPSVPGGVRGIVDVTAPTRAAQPRPSSGTPSPSSLDPPLPPLRPSTRPTTGETSSPTRAVSSSLEPARPSSRPTKGETPGSGALDPSAEPSGPSRHRPQRGAAEVPDAAPAWRKWGMALVGGVAVVTTLRWFTASAPSAALEPTDVKAVNRAWLADGVAAAGGRRPADGVTAAVERVARSLAPGLAGSVAPEVAAVVVVGGQEPTLFCLPDGTAVVNQAMLARLKTEGELAALLAHALAHVVRGDAARQLAPALRATQPGPEAAGPSAKVASATLASAASVALAKRFVADDEPDVDRIAVALLKKAGWSPQHYGPALERTLTPSLTPWAVQHAVTAARTAPPSGIESGRGDGPEYAQEVLRPLGAAKPPVKTTPTR